MCVGICLYLETAWFLHFICGRSMTIIFFFFKLVPLKRGSLNTGNVCLFVCLIFYFFIFFVSWEAGTAQKQLLWLPRGECVCAGGNGHSPGLGSIGQLLEVGDKSFLMQTVSQQLTVAINHYCVVQKSVVFPPNPLLHSASLRSLFFFSFF